MNVFISCDIEGVSCVARPEHSRVDGRDYIQSRRLMTGEANAAIRAAFDAGAENVVVADGHNVGLNLLPEELDQRAELVMGTPRPFSMMDGVEGCDVAFLIGYHSEPLIRGGVIQHNFTGRVRRAAFNGKTLGEIGMNAALAGMYGVPVALVSGDEAACAQAAALMPWVVTAAVKKGIGAYAARCLSPQRSRELIYENARSALGNRGSMGVFSLEGPVTMTLELTTASSADRLERVPCLHRISADTLESDPLPYRELYDVFLTATDLLDLVPFI
ncbi:MAG: M55 family metallopeptidase [Mailhella sp.]|nr:M55 family metallopeptidase [Mailhella sp.]